MTQAGGGAHRMKIDVMKLVETKHEITMLGGINDFKVKFYGPKATPYEGGVWHIRVQLPDEYPFKSPSIGFVNKIFHPNIDEESGSVCLDVINQAWTALYDLANIFETFLPQLLAYPNPKDPLNTEAAALFLREPLRYRRKVVDYVKRYATVKILRTTTQHESSDSESSLSDYNQESVDP